MMPNGKLNRRALPAPGRVRADLVTPFVPPGNPTESGIAEIWAETLEIDRVGLHDKFLDLGGNSISAMRVLARIRDRFHVKLSMQDVWKAETVAELCELLRPTTKD